MRIQALLSRQEETGSVTVQDLFRHTSGLTYGQFGDSLVKRAYREANMMDPQQTLAEMVTKLSQLPLAYQPGTTFEYSMSVDVLGRVIEVVSGMPLDQFIAERVTKPLHMVDSGFVVSESQGTRVAQPLTDLATGKRPPMRDVTKPQNFMSGGGGDGLDGGRLRPLRPDAPQWRPT